MRFGPLFNDCIIATHYVGGRLFDVSCCQRLDSFAAATRGHLVRGPSVYGEQDRIDFSLGRADRTEANRLRCLQLVLLALTPATARHLSASYG
jgi:hypothetical protein